MPTGDQIAFASLPWSHLRHRELLAFLIFYFFLSQNNSIVDLGVIIVEKQVLRENCDQRNEETWPVQQKDDGKNKDSEHRDHVTDGKPVWRAMELEALSLDH